MKTVSDALLEMDCDVGQIETVRHALYEILEACGDKPDGVPYNVAQVLAGELAGSVDALRKKLDYLSKLNGLRDLMLEEMAERRQLAAVGARQ